MHQNIAGLRSKFDALTISLQELSENDTVIDVICLTEHFMMSGHEYIYMYYTIIISAWLPTLAEVIPIEEDRVSL